MYINDLHQVAKDTERHHFADEIKLLYSNKSLEYINQNINFELKFPLTLIKQKQFFLEYMNFRISGDKK